jgi:flagellar assembly factor FliW
MRVCQTKYHGEIRFKPEQVLHVPAGLFGFSEEKEFLLLELPSSRPLVFVQSIRTPELCFISLPAQVVKPDYCLQMSPSDIESLGYAPGTPPVMGQDVLCLAFLTVRERQDTTANLLAPLVIDIAHHRGMQVMRAGEYSLQYPIVETEWRRAC